jgi:Flp pilus assembly protein TadD
MTEKDGERFESTGVVRVEDRDNKRPSVSDEGGSPRDYLERGRALLEEGRLNEAIAELSRATSLDSKLSQAHSLLAVAYDRKGLHDRAEDSYRRAIDANDRDPQAMNNLGYSLYLAGNYRAAVDKLKKAARLAPADSRILNNLALAQVRLGKYDDAYRNFARAEGEFNGHSNLAALLIRTGREEKAVEHLEAARKLQPESPNVLRQLAELYDRTGRGEKAADARQTLAAIDARQTVAAAAEER